MKKSLKTLSLFALMGISLMACREEEPTIANITVKDVDNKVIPGVTVILYGESTETPPKPVTRVDTAITDIFGVAAFDYTEDFQLGQAGFAVLNIDAKVTDQSGNTLSGTGTIKIEEEKINEEVVYIQ